jgi:hypothetical protein
MGSSLKARSLVGLLLLSSVVGVAGAQPSTPASSTQPPVQLGAGKDVALSVDEMVAAGKAAVPEMDRGAATVRRLLAEAREKRDVVRVLCLNDKLNQVDLAIRTASDRLAALDSAAAQKNADQTKHEYTVVTVLRDRVRTLVSESNQCIGEETGFVGESKVIVDIDPGVPDVDPDFPDDQIVITPPVLSSPVR